VLAHEIRGRGPRVVLVHGFGQDARCWGPLAEELARDHELVLVDAPGHGGSRATIASIEESADHLAPFGPARWIGYSMGGRMALALAIARPELVTELTLIGSTAGIEDPEERARRRTSDAALAEQLEREGTARFFDAWLAKPMFAGLPEALRFRREREEQDPIALARMLRRAGTGSMTPLWDRLSSIRFRLLCIAGERDEAFAEVAERMARQARGRAVVIPGAGHAAHLEAPDAVLAARR